jgi:hypothetical protein
LFFAPEMQARALLLSLAPAAFGFEYDETMAVADIWLHQAMDCPGTKGSNLTQWDCGLACSKATLTDVKVIENAFAKTFAVVAKQDQGCVLAFRGTKNAINTILDLDATQTRPYGDCPECAVHAGFYKAWQSLAKPARAAVQELGCASLRITGHSLGGAMAAVAAFELADELELSGVYTYGQPRTGNEDFVAAFNTRLGNVPYFRVVDYRDPIPHTLPDNLGYHHQTPEVYYHATELGAYAVCEEARDKTCSYQWNIITTSMHGCLHCSYLGLNPCDCDQTEPQCREGSLISLV